jgi:hypothetical protein
MLTERKIEMVKRVGEVVLLTLFLCIFTYAQGTVPMSPRAEIILNGRWNYVLNQAQATIPSSGWKTERVPGLPLSDGTSSIWYKRQISIPASWGQPNRHFFIELEKAGHYAAIYWNGTLIGEHFGQFAPFQVDITPAVLIGATNELEVYVHKADTTYVRPGVNIDQSSCPSYNPDCIGNAYRSAAPTYVARNWVGVVGDVTFSWAPAQNVSDAFVETSVRNSTIQADLQVTSFDSGTTIQASVLDGSTVVLTLPAQPVTTTSPSLSASWTNPVLWGPAPYGQPKLYNLRVDLLENGKIIDTSFTRFGFREVWIEGTDIMLNGQKLWMVGDYFYELSPTRYVNDRRPMAMLFSIEEASGMNTAENHWDDPGRPWFELADEMGMLVLAAFYCDGRPQIQSQADDVTAWKAWMSSTAAEWAQARRNHPSIILWRPVDVLPENVPSDARLTIDPAVRGEDPIARPMVDGTDAIPFAQPVLKSGGGCQTTTKKIANALATDTIPLLTKELFSQWNVSCGPSFVSDFYQVSFSGGAAGLMAQQMPLFNYASFVPDWFSLSGRGNRPTSSSELPNWNTQVWSATSWSTELAGLYQTYFNPALLNTSPSAIEYKISSLPSSVQVAFMVSTNYVSNPNGVLTDNDTAWFVELEPDTYQLVY